MGETGVSWGACLSTEALPHQESVLIYLRLYAPCECLEGFAQGADKLRIVLVGAAAVHLSLRLVVALKVELDVIERSVGVGIGLCVIVSPQLFARLHHGYGLGAEMIAGHVVDLLRLASEEVAVDGRLRQPAMDIVVHEATLEPVFRIHHIYMLRLYLLLPVNEEKPKRKKKMENESTERRKLVQPDSAQMM